MTIPWKMNCDHSAEGWCLSCTSELGDKMAKSQQDLQNAQIDMAAMVGWQAQNRDRPIEHFFTALRHEERENWRKSAQAQMVVLVGHSRYVSERDEQTKTMVERMNRPILPNHPAKRGKSVDDKVVIELDAPMPPVLPAPTPETALASDPIPEPQPAKSDIDDF